MSITEHHKFAKAACTEAVYFCLSATLLAFFWRPKCREIYSTRIQFEALAETYCSTGNALLGIFTSSFQLRKCKRIPSGKRISFQQRFVFPLSCLVTSLGTACIRLEEAKVIWDADSINFDKENIVLEFNDRLDRCSYIEQFYLHVRYPSDANATCNEEIKRVNLELFRKASHVLKNEMLFAKNGSWLQRIFYQLARAALSSYARSIREKAN